MSAFRRVHLFAGLCWLGVGLSCMIEAMRTLGVFALAVFAAGSAFAERAAASDGNPGRTAYLRYCASCHGADGTGGGVVVPALRTKPTDLTTLAKERGGKFPYRAVEESIDGRKQIAAHGSSEMPVWGDVFAGEKSYESPEAHARSQIGIITDHVRSMQRK